MMFNFLLCFFISVALLATASFAENAIYVCESAEPAFLGKYTASKDAKNDGAPVYSNDKDLSFFRNNKFWYLGNLGLWPPLTHYRCVEPEGCNYDSLVPPTTEEGTWRASKTHGKEPVPVISTTPCADKEEL